MAIATLRVKGSIAPDGKDVQPVVYDVDFEVSLPMRDLFAAFALAGMVSVDESQLGTPEGTARDCYLWADAMLAQRAQTKERTS